MNAVQVGRKQSEFTSDLFTVPTFAVVAEDDGSTLYCDRAGCTWAHNLPRHVDLNTLNRLADGHWHRK